MEIRISKEKFKTLKKLNKDDFLKLIEENLNKAELTLMAEREGFLLKKKEKLEEKFREIEGQLDELKTFYEKALHDRKLMREMAKKLREENLVLKKEMEAKRRALNNKTG